MSRLQKVVWYEGMQLDPHHFQQESRYTHALLQFQTRLLQPNFWGLSELKLDDEARVNGQIGLNACSGVMPDGLVFSMPKNDVLPPPRNIEEHFSPTKEKLGVYLAIRSEKEGGMNCEIDGEMNGDATRFSLKDIEVRDETANDEPRGIDVTRANFRIKFEGEPLGDFTTIKIAEINAPTAGIYSFNTDFIPSCVAFSASDALNRKISDLLRELIASNKKLIPKTPFGKQEIDFSAVETFAKLQTLNAYIPTMNHLHKQSMTHPETIYRTLLMLGGELAALKENAHFKSSEFPEYEHGKLTECFRELFRRVQLMAHEEEKRDRFEEIDLQPDTNNPSLFRGALTETQIDLSLYLGVRGDMPENEIVNGLPMNVKIASDEEIFAIVAAGLQGCTLENVQMRPEELPDLAGMHFFVLSKEPRQFWKSISETHKIAFFTADQFAGLEMRLYAVTK